MSGHMFFLYSRISPSRSNGLEWDLLSFATCRNMPFLSHPHQPTSTISVRRQEEGSVNMRWTTIEEKSEIKGAQFGNELPLRWADSISELWTVSNCVVHRQRRVSVSSASLLFKRCVISLDCLDIRKTEALKLLPCGHCFHQVPPLHSSPWPV